MWRQAKHSDHSEVRFKSCSSPQHCQVLSPHSKGLPLSLHISTNFPIPFVGSPASTHGDPGRCLNEGHSRAPVLCRFIVRHLRKIGPKYKQCQAVYCKKLFLMSHDAVLGEWGTQKTFADGINMWNPGDKCRFPFLCNTIILLNFNKAFQNIVNSPHNLLCCHNYSRK